MNRQSTQTPKAVGARSTKVRAVNHEKTEVKTKIGSPTEYSEQLAIDNIKLAQKHAHVMSIRTKMPYEDLYQVALIGLIKACRKYDPSKVNPDNGKPYKLSTIAVPFIDGAMYQYLRDRGHSTGVKFPDRWRDKASIVRKMSANGSCVEDIATATNLRADEVNEILTAQSAPVALDPEIKLYSNSIDDSEYEDFYELIQALAIVDRAHAAISTIDQGLLEAAWNHQRRRQIATGPFFQFMQRAKKVLSGVSIVIEKQIDLSIEVKTEENLALMSSGKRRVSDPKEIIDTVMSQLDLF